MRRALPLAVCALLLAVPVASEAQRRPFNAGGVSVLGGQILPQNHNALAAGGLYPSIAWGQYTFALGRTFDLGLRGDLFWASPLSTNAFGWGFGFGVPMRIGLSQGQKVSFALKLAPDFIIGEFGSDYYGCYHDRFGTLYCRGQPGWSRRYYNDYYGDDYGYGFGVDFGLLVGIPVSIVNIICGITSPFHLVYLSDAEVTGFSFPIAPFGGAEVRLTDNLNVFGMFQFGVAFETWEGYHSNDGYFRFWAGIEYAM